MHIRSLYLVVAALVLVACGQEKEAINIAGGKWLGYQQFFIASELGKHAEMGQGNGHAEMLRAFHHDYHLTMFPSHTPMLRLIANGRLDGGMVTLDEAIVLQSKSSDDYCLASVIDYSNGADALVVHASYIPDKSIPMRIGYEPTAAAAFLLSRATSFLGMSGKNIQLISMRPEQHMDAFRTGKVDALLTYEPYLSRLEKHGARVLFSSRDIPNEIIDVLMLRKRVWDERGADIERMVRLAREVGLQPLLKLAPEALEIAIPNTGLNQDELHAALQKVHFPGSEEEQLQMQSRLPEVIGMLEQHLIETSAIDRKSRLQVCRQP